MGYLILAMFLIVYAWYRYSNLKASYRSLLQYTTAGYGRNNGYIYFFRQKGSSMVSPIKIGRTNNLPVRLKQHRTALPNGLYLVGAFRTLDAVKAERRIHAYFDDSRVRFNNEWFHPTLGLIVLIWLIRDKKLTERIQNEL